MPLCDISVHTPIQLEVTGQSQEVSCRVTSEQVNISGQLAVVGRIFLS